MLKLGPMLPSTLWVSEQVRGVCQQGLCQISESRGRYRHVSSEGRMFRFSSRPFPHTLHLHISVCHSARAPHSRGKANGGG